MAKVLLQTYSLDRYRLACGGDGGVERMLPCRRRRLARRDEEDDVHPSINGEVLVVVVGRRRRRLARRRRRSTVRMRGIAIASSIA